MAAEQTHSDLLDRVRRLNSTLAIISRTNSVLVHARSEAELYAGACDAITSAGVGFTLAWVGVPMADERKSVAVVASAGSALEYLDGIDVRWDDGPHGSGPTGRAIRTGTVQYNNRMLASTQFVPWVERARHCGLESSFVLPIKLADSTVVAALMVYSGTPDAFGDEELALLGQLSADLGYGVEALRTRAAYDRALEQAREHERKVIGLLEASIEVLAYTLELRDPYTAGHEKRVADLSVAIARELGLDEQRIQGIRLAAMVHDIGKIRVPAEILVHPGRLTEFEYKLIQEHPAVGYQVLRQIEYPWPVAEAVWQHHERLDGSGYPQGLRGEQIILEARIIAVADVVEAMSSHRPYRPALGNEVALEEIRRQSPDKLDARVVEACTELFRSGRFVFEHPEQMRHAGT